MLSNVVKINLGPPTQPPVLGVGHTAADVLS
jgi:hypothetical protein